MIGVSWFVFIFFVIKRYYLTELGSLLHENSVLENQLYFNPDNPDAYFMFYVNEDGLCPRTLDEFRKPNLLSSCITGSDDISDVKTPNNNFDLINSTPNISSQHNYLQNLNSCSNNPQLLTLESDQLSCKNLYFHKETKEKIFYLDLDHESCQPEIKKQCTERQGSKDDGMEGIFHNTKQCDYGFSCVDKYNSAIFNSQRKDLASFPNDEKYIIYENSENIHLEEISIRTNANIDIENELKLIDTVLGKQNNANSSNIEPKYSESHNCCLQNPNNISYGNLEVKNKLPDISTFLNPVNNLNFSSSCTRYSIETMNLENYSVKSSIKDTIHLFSYIPLKLSIFSIPISTTEIKINDYFQLIATDYLIYYVHIINIINADGKKILNGKKFEENFDLDVCEEFARILSKTFPIDYKKLAEMTNLKDYYNSYVVFENWVEKNYNLSKMIDQKSYLRQLKATKERFRKSENIEILNAFIEIFKSKNYSLLFKILPCFNLIYKINEINLANKRILFLSRYLLLVLCKYDVFRYNYFKKAKKDYESIEKLQITEEYNETLAIISVFLRNIMLIINVPDFVLKVLEVYCFVYFLRAKYYKVFQRYGKLKILTNIDVLYSDTFIIRKNNSKNITSIRFKQKYEQKALLQLINTRLEEIRNKILIKNLKLKRIRKRRQKE